MPTSFCFRRIAWLAKRSRVGLALASALASLAFARGASAVGLPPIVVHRTADTMECPDATALAAAVAKQMKRAALQPASELPAGHDRGLDVQIYRSDQGFTAVIQAAGKTRQLSDNGATCASLGAALAVSIAVLLDTDPPPPEPDLPPLPAPSVEVEAPPARETVPVPAPRRPPPPPAESTAAADEPPFTEPRRFRVTLAAAPLVSAGLLEAIALGITSEVEVRVGRFSIAGGVFVLPSQSFPFGPGQVRVELTTGVVRFCAAVLSDGETRRIALCLDPYGGAVRGSSTGFQPERAATLPWAAVGASALFHQRIWGPLSMGARASLVIPVVKGAFSVDSGASVFAPSPIGGALDAELRVLIW